MALIPQGPWGSLPVHLTTLGVSQNALSAARYQADVPYARKLAEVKKSVADNQGKHDPPPRMARGNSHSPPRYQVPLHLIPVELHGRPVSTGTLFGQIQQGQAGRVSEGSRVSPPRGALHFTAPAMSTESYKPPLQELDFQAMADSSVGGSGLPRPYGRFVGDRAGDGKAVYERRPTSRAASWHAKVFGIPDPTKAPEGSKPKHHTSLPSHECLTSSEQPQELPSKQAATQAHPKTQQDRSRFWRPSGTRTVTADPSWPNVQVSRFPLPAATFLAAAPPLPANLRVDCGDGAAQELLRSAQSPPRPRPPPFTQLSLPGAPLEGHRPATVNGSRGWTAPEVPGSPNLMRNRGGAPKRSSVPHHQDRSNSAGAALPGAHDAAHAGDGQQQALDLPGYKRQRGLYIPVNQEADESVRTSLGLHNHACPVPHTTEVLAALAETHRVRKMSPLHSSAPILATSHPCYHCSIRPPLPAEQALPRRYVPWQGR